MNKREQDGNAEVYFSVDEKLPEKNLHVIVICRGYRCLGYLDTQGVWRGHFKGEELKDVVGWHP